MPCTAATVGTPSRPRHRIRGFHPSSSTRPRSASRFYGEDARPAAETAFKALLGKPFPLDQDGDAEPVGAEVSPYGFPLGITYP